MRDLRATFEKWGIRQWDVECAVPVSRSKSFLGVDEREVILSFFKDGAEIRLPMSDHGRPVDNLRVLTISVEDMRMIERRGLNKLYAQAYLQLEGPKNPTKRDPYLVLGVRPDAPAEVIEASYKALAKRMHPDAGGSTEAMVELQEAYAAVKA